MPKFSKKITKDDLRKVVMLKNLENKIKLLKTLPRKDSQLSMKITDIKINEPEDYDGLVVSWFEIYSGNEYPIYIAIYIDPQDRIRGFLPIQGNTYNPWTMTPFGGEYIYDNCMYNQINHCINMMPKQYYEYNQEKHSYQETDEYRNDFNNIKPDMDKMIKELITYVKVV